MNTRYLLLGFIVGILVIVLLSQNADQSRRGPEPTSAYTARPTVIRPTPTRMRYTPQPTRWIPGGPTYPVSPTNTRRPAWSSPTPTRRPYNTPVPITVTGKAQ